MNLERIKHTSPASQLFPHQFTNEDYTHILFGLKRKVNTLQPTTKKLHTGMTEEMHTDKLKN